VIHHIIIRSYQLWLPRLLSDYSHLRFNRWGVNHFTQALTQNPPPLPPEPRIEVGRFQNTYHFDRSKNYEDFHLLFFFFLLCCDPTRAMVSSFSRFLDHTQRRTTLCSSDQLVSETRQNTTLTTDKHPYSLWDSKPQSQQASGRRPTP